MCSSQPGLSQCTVRVWKETFPVSLRWRGAGLQLRGGLVHTFTRWGRGGRSCSPLHTTLLSQKHSINHHNLVVCTNGEGRAVPRALSPGPKHLTTALRATCSGHQSEATSAAEWSAENTGSPGAHLLGCIPMLTWALRQRRSQGQEPKAQGRVYTFLSILQGQNIYHNTGRRTRSVRVPRSI